MMKIVLGALALTGATTPALATETSWSTTDRDLASLSSSLTQGASGVSVSGFLRSSYVGWSDADVGAFSIDDAQIWVNGTVGDFSVTVQLEGASNADDNDGNGWDVDGDGEGDTYENTPFSVSSLGQVSVLDAYASWNATEMIKVQMGQFRPAFLASSARNENQLLFINRSMLGAAGSYRSQGAQASASFGMINVAVFAQNGEEDNSTTPDGIANDDLSFGFRASAQIMGTASANEGALGASGDPSLSVGIGYIDDAAQFIWVASPTNPSRNVDECIAVDANFTMGALSIAAEIVDITGNDADATEDATPYNVAGSFVVMPDQLEAALRFEDFDDADNTTWITFGANWYLQGHAAKWQVNYVTSDSDNGDLKEDMFQVGLTVSM
jgi:hypothetical protein